MAGAVWRVPGGQAPSADRHALAFFSLLYCPAGQASQVRSVVEVPAAATRVPGWQSRHGAHWATLLAAAKVPRAQAAQVRSVVAVPPEATRVPGWQVVIAVHSEALVEAE